MPQAPVVWRLATVRQLIDETPRARTLVLDVPDWPGHRRPARRRPAHGRRRLPDRTLLLDRFRAGVGNRRADRGADRRRGGLAVPDRGASPRRHARTPGTVHQLLRLAHRGRWAAAADRRRIWTGATDGDAAPPRCQLEHGRGAAAALRPLTRRRPLSRRARRTYRRRAGHALYVHPRATTGLARIRAADRRGDAQDRRTLSPRAAAHLHLRPNRVRRARGRPARPARSPARRHPHRAVRPLWMSLLNDRPCDRRSVSMGLR